MNLEPIGTRIMQATRMDKDTEIAVCECGCKRFSLLVTSDYVFTHCMHCKKTESLGFNDPRVAPRRPYGSRKPVVEPITLQEVFSRKK